VSAIVATSETRRRPARADRPDQDPRLASEVERAVSEIAGRRSVVGLAVGAVCRDRIAIAPHGVADVTSRTPIAERTVFRIASITKTFTAIAIMQLVEAGAIDLDQPATKYLRAYQLVTDGFPPPTVRHLLSHTAGIPDVRRLADLLHAGLTPGDGRPPHLSVPFGEALPSLAEYYRDGLRVVAEPGRFFAYSNHGFATLGQIVEDVTGLPLERYVRERILEPLGMADTDLERSDRVASSLARGHRIGRRGPTETPDRDWIGRGSGGAYSTAADLALYASALLGGGSNDRGTIVAPATLEAMFGQAYPSDPRIPGIGLGFFRGDVAGHRIVHHDGILPGFNAALVVAPDDDVAVFGLTNGSPGAFAWLPVELEGLLRRLLDLPEGDARPDLPEHPDAWADLCGRYAFPPRVADLRQRLMLGGGAVVAVRGGRLHLRVNAPIPALYRGFPLEPADPADPDVFRLDLTPYGMAPVRVVFARNADRSVAMAHTDLGGKPWTFVRRPDSGSRSRWLAAGVAAAGAAGLATFARRRRTP